MKALARHLGARPAASQRSCKVFVSFDAGKGARVTGPCIMSGSARFCGQPEPWKSA